MFAGGEIVIMSETRVNSSESSNESTSMSDGTYSTSHFNGNHNNLQHGEMILNSSTEEELLQKYKYMAIKHPSTKAPPRIRYFGKYITYPLCKDTFMSQS